MDPLLKAERLSHALACCLNELGLFAAPRCFAKYSNFTNRGSKEYRQSVFTELMATLGDEATWPSSSFIEPPEGGGEQREVDFKGLVDELQAFDKLLRTWNSAELPGESLVAQARAALARYGFPEPPGGWDSFEGPSKGSSAEI
jgi:hypothetical protein